MSEVAIREPIGLRGAAAPTSRRVASAATTIVICVLAAVYPIQSSAVGDVNLSAGDIVVALLFLGVAWRFVREPVPLPRYMPQVLTLAVVIVTSVVVNAFTWTTYYRLSDGAMEVVKFFAIAAWMIAIFALLRPQLTRRFTQFALASVVVAAFWSVRTVIENVVFGVQRPTGPFDNANMYANYIVLNVFLALGTAKLLAEDTTGRLVGGLAWLRKRRSLLTIVILPTLVLGLLSSGSRGGMLAFAAGMLASVRLWFPKRITFRMVTTAALGFALFGAGVGWFLEQHPYVLKRVERTGMGDRNVEERLELWKAARAAFQERPVLGIGYGEFRRYADYEHHLTPKVAHQMYLSVAAELGVVGFLAFIWLLLSVLWDSSRIRTPIRGAIAWCCCGALTAAYVQGFVANVEQLRTLWIVFGIVAATLSVREPGALGATVQQAGCVASSWRAQLRRPLRKTVPVRR